MKVTPFAEVNGLFHTYDIFCALMHESWFRRRQKAAIIRNYRGFRYQIYEVD